MAQLGILIFEILIKDRNSFFNRSPPWCCRPDCLRSLFKIRIVPSLATLKLVQGSHPDCHSQTGALIVADPEIGELIYKPRKAQKHNAIAVCKEAGSRDDCKTSWPNTFDWRSRDKVCCTSSDKCSEPDTNCCP